MFQYETFQNTLIIFQLIQVLFGQILGTVFHFGTMFHFGINVAPGKENTWKKRILFNM